MDDNYEVAINAEETDTFIPMRDGNVIYIPSKDATEIASDSYVEYSKYTIRTRIYPSVIDGLKTVFRRTLFASKDYRNKVKSATIVGEGIKYHPHGDGNIYGALLSMACRFNAFPLYSTKGNFGGLGFGAAAMRYTEACMSEMSRLMFLELLDYAEFVDGEAGHREPKHLPALLPYSLLTGSTGLPVGMPKPLIPAYNCLDLINYYIAELEGTEKPVPILDYGEITLDCTLQDIIDLNQTGVGKIWFKGFVIQEDYNKFVVTQETPDKSIDKVIKKLQSLIDQEIVDYINESDKDGYRHVFVINNLNKCNPDHLKTTIEKTMASSLSFRMIFEEDGKATFCNLDYVMRKNLNYLRECSVRKYESLKNRSERTLLVLQAIEAFKQSGNLHNLIKWTDVEFRESIVNLGFEDSIAKEAITKPMSYLTKSHKTEIEDLRIKISEYEDLMNNPDKYLLTLYHRLRDYVVKFHDSRSHSILLEDIQKLKLRTAIFKDNKIEIDTTGQSEGLSWNNNLYLIDANGILNSKYIASKKSITIDLSEEGNYTSMTNDKGDYLVVIYEERHISVRKRSDVWDGLKFFTPWDGATDIRIFTSKSNMLKLHLERQYSIDINLDDYLKSRVSKPIRVSSDKIIGVEDIVSDNDEASRLSTS